MANYDIKTIEINDKNYPTKLKYIKKPPKKLWYIGELPCENKKTVAIVGSRTSSSYGNMIAKSIAKLLSSNDIQVISGLALGIDTNAHLGAIEAKTKNYAVLGSGVNVCYPSYNYAVYDKIIELGGGIISEQENDTLPMPYNFPLRNRIIAGLSDIVIIVEGKIKSGAIITCDYAAEQGKDIFAVPGRIGDVLSEGPNNLIKEGAYILTKVEDIFDRLNVIYDKKLTMQEKNIDKLDYFEKIVYESLEIESKHIDEIIMRTKLPLDKCINTLVGLQINGYVSSPTSNYYCKIV